MIKFIVFASVEKVLLSNCSAWDMFVIPLHTLLFDCHNIVQTVCRFCLFQSLMILFSLSFFSGKQTISASQKKPIIVRRGFAFLQHHHSPSFRQTDAATATD